MYTLVRKNKIASGAESATHETYESFDSALKKFYLYLSNNVADENVMRFDIIILNNDLIPCKTEHFVREVPKPEPEIVKQQEQEEPIPEE